MSLPPIHQGASAGRNPDELDLDEPLRLTAVVHGAVQGVGFRWWTAHRAEELGLVGSAVNNTDGTVGIIAEGPRRAVRDLLQALHGREAPGAVMKVDSHYGPATGEFSAFVTG
ncbi:acylphosphatase [Kocuria sediminis]|uniref:acylphosphatase n=1 Tax=Kocuria sediminis TaxID=1038857 RepID=A0A6N8GIF5_9MICC|nr:acylphosphatase [Kocuria sediminis]